MMKLTNRDILRVPHVGLSPAKGWKIDAVSSVSTDSRTAGPGCLFVAIRGEKFDGHTFVAMARQRGAVAAIVDEKFIASSVEGFPLMMVTDTVAALGALAAIYREKFKIPLVAVGGSNGKTTTKDMIAAVLGTSLNVIATEGNLNNHIGAPSTIFRLERRHKAAVIELGTNHPGELEHLCSFTRPTHALITNIGREHLEFFGTLKGVAAEELTLFRSLNTKPAGVAIVNVDDPLLRPMLRKTKKHLAYGFTNRGAGVRGKDLTLDDGGCAQFSFKGPSMKRWMPVHLGVPGRHNAINALAAASVGLALKVPGAKIARALESFRSSDKRMESLLAGGVRILNDTYNANPDSMIAALKTLAAAKNKGKAIAVLGDMRELGAASEEAHRTVGREARALHVDYVLTFGEQARFIHEAAQGPGAVHYDNKNMMAEYLAELVTPGDTVLVKGSRGMTMEDVVTFLQQRLTRPETVR
jgi:UDP-N-acetylmuramoyl-tripeptide--D-alanyl-D-alanine ligase